MTHIQEFKNLTQEQSSEVIQGVITADANTWVSSYIVKILGEILNMLRTKNELKVITHVHDKTREYK